MFIVDYEALDSLKESIIGQKSQNDLVLEGIKSALRELRDTQTFTGEGADSIKSYISPSDGIYGTIFNALDQITQTQKDAVLLYCFYYFLYVDNSDAYLQTYINTDEIEGIRQTLVNSTTSASDHANSILSELNAINDIYSHDDISSIENLMGYIEYDSNDASNTIIELQNNIEAVETAGLITLMQSAVEQAISDLLNLLDGLYSQIRTSSIDFSHTDMLTTQIAAVQNSSQALFDLRCSFHGDIQSARDYSVDRAERLQYIDEAATARWVGGVQGVLVDGMIIVGGVTLILGTGGIGAIPGGGMIIYGTSNLLQHSQEIYYGLRGDIYTSSVNPVCEVYFDGDETLYNLAGQVCVITSVCLIMPPVAAGVVIGTTYCSGEIAVYGINYLRTSSGMEPLSDIDAQWVRIGVDTIVGLGMSYSFMHGGAQTETIGDVYLEEDYILDFEFEASTYEGISIEAGEYTLSIEDIEALGTVNASDEYVFIDDIDPLWETSVTESVELIDDVSPEEITSLGELPSTESTDMMDVVSADVSDSLGELSADEPEIGSEVVEPSITSADDIPASPVEGSITELDPVGGLPAVDGSVSDVGEIVGTPVEIESLGDMPVTPEEPVEPISSDVTISEGVRIPETSDSINPLTGLSRELESEIVSLPQGSRPDPATYMSAEQITIHLSQFEDGVTIFASRDAYCSYMQRSIGWDDGSQFVMPRSVADEILAAADGNPEFIEEALGLRHGSIGEHGLIRVDIDPEAISGLRMPSGNEFGANSQWRPGGYTSGGTPEAVIDVTTNDSGVMLNESGGSVSGTPNPDAHVHVTEIDFSEEII